MGGIFIEFGGNKNYINLWKEKLKGTDHMEKQYVNRRIILKNK